MKTGQSRRNGNIVFKCWITESEISKIFDFDMNWEKYALILMNKLVDFNDYFLKIGQSRRNGNIVFKMLNYRKAKFENIEFQKVKFWKFKL